MNFEKVTLAISDLDSCGDRFPKYVPTYYIMIHRCVDYLVYFESYILISFNIVYWLSGLKIFIC